MSSGAKSTNATGLCKCQLRESINRIANGSKGKRIALMPPIRRLVIVSMWALAASRRPIGSLFKPPGGYALGSLPSMFRCRNVDTVLSRRFCLSNSQSCHIIATGVSHMCPTIGNENLHLVDQTKLAGFQSTVGFGFPTIDSSPNDEFLQKWRCSPASKAIFPEGNCHILQPNPGGSGVNLVVG